MEFTTVTPGFTPESRWLRLVMGHPVALAVAVAAAGALPSLAIPFMADDWLNLASISNQSFFRTAYGYFRPAYLGTYWLDSLLWGLTPWAFHLTNLLLICASTGLMVAVIGRYTGDAVVTALAGLMLALHPFHVGNAAWIAARSDPMYGLFSAAALLCYDRWRTRRMGLPIAALLLYEVALLSKEAAITLPAVVILIGYLDRGRRPTSREWVAGYLPFACLTLLHFVLVRPWALGSTAVPAMGAFGKFWVWKLLGFSVCAVLPMPIEILEADPLAWGITGAVTGGCLLLAAWLHAGGIPSMALAAALLFVVLLVPSLISFQERYYFVPGAAAALAVAALIRASHRGVARVTAAVLVTAWLMLAAWQWMAWIDAGHVSEALISELARASRRDGVREVLLVNVPYRVHGVPVVGDFGTAIALLERRRVRVLTAAEVDYPTGETNALDGSYRDAVHVGPDAVTVRLRLAEGLFSRYDGPLPRKGGDRVELGYASILLSTPGVIQVLIPAAAAAARPTFVWSGGRLTEIR